MVPPKSVFIPLKTGLLCLLLSGCATYRAPRMVDVDTITTEKYTIIIHTYSYSSAVKVFYYNRDTGELERIERLDQNKP